MYVRVTSALAAATLLTLAANAQAQSLPPEGELHVTYTATQMPPVSPMPIGDGKQYLQVNYIINICPAQPCLKQRPRAIRVWLASGLKNAVASQA
jgi:hypothetical protein